MKTRVIALAAILAVALSAVAYAGHHKVVGRTAGDSNSRVTLTVKTKKNGRATLVTKVVLKRIDYLCYGASGTSAGEKTVIKSVSMKIGKHSHAFSGNVVKRGITYTVSGTFTSKKGTKVIDGRILSTFGGNNGQTCEIKTEYTAKVK